MPDQATITIRDYSNELSRMTINTVDITAGNITAQLAALQTLVTDIGPIIYGEVAETVLKIVTPGSSTPPTDPLAQIETRWLVIYADTQQYLDPPTDTVLNPGFGKLFQVEIPCADLEGDNLLTNSDLADLTDTQIAAFVTAFQAIARSPYGGTVTVNQIRLVGSNT